MKIEAISSRQILDSRGYPTLETTVRLDTGDVGVASVPSGASTGSHEAVELRDNGAAYGGRGVLNAISNVEHIIAKLLKGQDVRDQRALDQAMIDADGTVNKSQLGANAILSVSLAAVRAHAALTRQPVHALLRSVFDLEVASDQRPGVMMNILNGGKHADNGLKIQEFLILPHGKTVPQMIERGVEVYAALWSLLRERNLTTLLGDEGGFAPSLASETMALDLILEAIEKAGLEAGKDIHLGLDMAATTFYDAGKDRYLFGPDHSLAAVGMMGLLDEWSKKYPLATIEDPLAEDDWENWAVLTEKFRSRLTLIGDDLFVTSPARLDRGIAAKVANGVLIKPNQIGTVTEAMSTVEQGRQAGYAVIASHRSGETLDTFITDFAVAVGADYLKAGAPARGERVAKYNRYLAIDEELNG